jgi:hypothetical protein
MSLSTQRRGMILLLLLSGLIIAICMGPEFGNSLEFIA